MRKTVKQLFLAGLLGFILTGCTNEMENFFSNRDVTTINVSAKEFQPETRYITYGYSQYADYSVIWKSDDVIGIFPMKENSSQIAFKINSGSYSGNASFDGNGWGLLNNTSYVAYYPYYDSGLIDKEEVPLDYTGQFQNDNKSTKHLSDFDFLYSSIVTPADGAVSFVFNHLSALMHFTFTFPSRTKVSKIELLTDGEFYPKGSFNLETSTFVPDESSQTTAMGLDLDDILNYDGGDLTEIQAFMMLPPTDLTGKSLSIVVTDCYGRQTTFDIEDEKYKKFESGHIYHITNASDSEIVIDVSSFDREYVDLGIRDSNGKLVLWATCNVGADSPEEHGNFFMWGETKGLDSGITDFSKWASVPYTYNGASFYVEDPSNWKFTKYVTQGSQYGYNGFYDNKTVLDACDDAATANWGDLWRTPTKDELGLLVNNCSYTWYAKGNTEYNGVAGFKFTGKGEYAENSIFIPAAVYYVYGTHYNENTYSVIMSSSLVDPNFGFGELFTSNGKPYATWGNRNEGMNVRPVCKYSIAPQVTTISVYQSSVYDPDSWEGRESSYCISGKVINPGSGTIVECGFYYDAGGVLPSTKLMTSYYDEESGTYVNITPDYCQGDYDAESGAFFINTNELNDVLTKGVSCVRAYSINSDGAIGLGEIIWLSSSYE